MDFRTRRNLFQKQKVGFVLFLKFVFWAGNIAGIVTIVTVYYFLFVFILLNLKKKKKKKHENVAATSVQDRL